MGSTVRKGPRQPGEPPRRDVLARRRRRDRATEDGRGQLPDSIGLRAATDQDHALGPRSLCHKRIQPIGQRTQHSLDRRSGEMRRSGVRVGEAV